MLEPRILLPVSDTHAWFLALLIRSSVYPYFRVPFQKFARITFIRKNAAAYVKITFSVAVSLPFPFR